MICQDPQDSQTRTSSNKSRKWASFDPAGMERTGERLFGSTSLKNGKTVAQDWM